MLPVELGPKGNKDNIKNASMQKLPSCGPKMLSGLLPNTWVGELVLLG